MAEPKFERCPFCGNSNVTFEKVERGAQVAKFALCQDCRAKSTIFVDFVHGPPEKVTEKVYEAWNRRPRRNQKDLRKLVREIKDDLELILASKDKRSINKKQKDATNSIAGRIDLIIPTASVPGDLVPLRIVPQTL